jgi:hypothetical protein
MNNFISEYIKCNDRPYNEFFVDLFTDWIKEKSFDNFSIIREKGAIIRIDLANKNKKIILLQHHDYLYDRTDSYFSNKSVIDNIRKVANDNKDAQILFLSSMIKNLIDLESISNLKYIYFGSDYLLEKNFYSTEVTPVMNKINNGKHWVSISRIPRLHRMLSAIFLLGSGLHFTGELRISPYVAENLESWQELGTFDISQVLDYAEVFDLGFKKFKSLTEYRGQPDYDIIYSVRRSNAENFEINLRSIYTNSVIEIVNETIFFESSGLITEKYLHSVYGCNFPIILSSQHAVKHLRMAGFDMFDDVIDHSYSNIEDPLLRLVTAIDSNRTLLIDTNRAFELWYQHQDRFAKNIEFARRDFYSQQKKNIIITLNRELLPLL